MRNWSYELHMTKQAKLESQARFPAAVKPEATPTRFDSAMPTLKNRSGNFLAKKSVCVELCTSPSTTTISGFSSPSLAKATPKASRTDFPIFMSHILDEVVCQFDFNRRKQRKQRRDYFFFFYFFSHCKVFF